MGAEKILIDPAVLVLAPLFVAENMRDVEASMPTSKSAGKTSSRVQLSKKSR
jgi:hypothetical protein